MGLFSAIKTISKYGFGYKGRFRCLEDGLRIDLHRINLYEVELIKIKKLAVNKNILNMCKIFENSFENIKIFYSDLYKIVEDFYKEYEDIKRGSISMPDFYNPAVLYPIFNKRIDKFEHYMNQGYKVIDYWGSMTVHTVKEMQRNKNLGTQNSIQFKEINNGLKERLQKDKDDFDFIIKEIKK